MHFLYEYKNKLLNKSNLLKGENLLCIIRTTKVNCLTLKNPNEIVFLRRLHTERMINQSVNYLSLRMVAQQFELTKK